MTSLQPRSRRDSSNDKSRTCFYIVDCKVVPDTHQHRDTDGDWLVIEQNRVGKHTRIQPVYRCTLADKARDETSTRSRNNRSRPKSHRNHFPRCITTNCLRRRRFCIGTNPLLCRNNHPFGTCIHRCCRHSHLYRRICAVGARIYDYDTEIRSENTYGCS